MDNDLIQDRWTLVKGKIRARWGKFSNSDVESVKNNMDELANKIQSVYGYAKAHAEREYHEFRISLRPVLHPVIKAPTPRV